MIDNSSEHRFQQAKSQSRGVSCDISPKAILRRLDIVDELRELAKDLQNAKRLGPVKSEPPRPSPTPS